MAQSHRGKRAAAHVVANGAVPAALLLLRVPPVAFVASLGAALADTLGTEVGTLCGRRAFSPVTFRALPPGAPGAISWPGTAASLGGAALIALAGVLLGFIAVPLVWVAGLAGFVGALAESLLNRLGPRAGFRLDHEFANALNTFVSAMIALRLSPGIAP
jgi:uncharacterized protein (TIGR00297 family)